MDFHKINFQRVGWLLRQNVVEHWKTHLRYYLGLQVGFLIALLLFIYNVLQVFTNGYNEEDTYEALGIMAHSMASIGCITLYAAFIFSASAVFSLKTERSKRIVQLMTPATTAEKVLSRFILYNLGAIVLSFSALLFTDLVGFFVVEAFDLDYVWFTPKMLANVCDSLVIPPFSSEDFQPLLGSWSLRSLPIFSIVVLWSFYLWGGAVFRKKSFIMTSLFCFIIFVIFSAITTSVIVYYSDIYNWYDNESKLIVNIVFTTYYLIGWVWLAANIFFGYRIRKRASLMPRHWVGQ